MNDERYTPLVLARSAFTAIVEHAREASPNECCGLLVGTHARIDAVVRARNLEESPTRFVIDPLDHFTAIRLARMRGQAVVGVYHSHPNGPAHPSARDFEEATYKEYVYLIVIPDPPAIAAFILNEGNFSEISLTAESD